MTRARGAAARPPSLQRLAVVVLAGAAIFLAAVLAAIVPSHPGARSRTAAAPRHPAAAPGPPRRHRNPRRRRRAPRSVIAAGGGAASGGLDPSSVDSSLPPLPQPGFGAGPPSPVYTVPPGDGGTGGAGGAGGPGPLALRFDDVSSQGYLARPGIAISSGQLQVGYGSTAVFATGMLRRPTVFTGAPVPLRLHLTDSGNTAVTLTVTLVAITPAGATRTLDSGSVPVSAATAARGPRSDATGVLPGLRGTLPAGDEFGVKIGVAAGSPQVTLYYGALPGQDTGFNQNYQRSQGGPDPARLTVPVSDTGTALTG